MEKVSIIIPCYNKDKYIRETLESVLNQTYSNTEIIVINDGSTDNSRNIILDIKKIHPEIIFIDEKENLGVCKARNKAIELSSGNYILPVDADDIIDRTYVEKLAKALDENPSYSIAYSNVRYFQDINSDCDCKFNEENILLQNSIASSSMMRKSAFYEAGKYKEWLNNYGCEDWELWISLWERGFKFYKVDEILYFYRKLKNEDCLTKVYKSHLDTIHYLLFKHHSISFLNNKIFLKTIYDDNFLNFKKFQNKLKKYRKIYKILLYVSIIELISLIILVSYFFWYGGG